MSRAIRNTPWRFWVAIAIIACSAAAAGLRARSYFSAAPAEKSLTLWYLSPPENVAEKRFTEDLLRRFEQKHPGVKVMTTYYTLDQYLRALDDAFSGKTAFPDVARGDQGPHSVDRVISQGKLLDLTSAAARYRWQEHLRPGVLEYLSRRYKGGMYLIPSRLHLSGVFYNHHIFEKLGLKPPETEAEFVEILERLKKEDYSPIPISQGEHMMYCWYALINNRLGAHVSDPIETLEGLFAGKPVLSFNSPPFLDAAEKLKDWTRRGYISPDSQGGYQAYDSFLKGQVGLYIGLGGSWARSRAQIHPPQFIVGYFPFPPAQKGQKLIATGAPTGVWQVFDGQDEEQAVALVDHMLSVEAGRVMLESQNLSSLRTELLSRVAVAPHVAEEMAALNGLELGIFYDNASPSLRSVMIEGLPRAVRGSIPIHSFLDQVEKSFQDDLKKTNPAAPAPVGSDR